MTNSVKQHQLRLRVFAGPNGSGKSTVIDFIKKYRSKGKAIDFGYYINADEIAHDLREKGFSFSGYRINVTNKEFRSVALASGLVNHEFNEKDFTGSYSLRKNMLKVKTKGVDERIAQIAADFLRKKLLSERRRFSFETVFSHHSKLDIMKQAAEAGYKVYLYFVSTESPEINKYRVMVRVAKGGHGVPPDKIENRYYRSLELLYDASQIAYQSFYFDNSVEGVDFKMFAHFKKRGGQKKWDRIDKKGIPQWFRKYYARKVKRS